MKKPLLLVVSIGLSFHVAFAGYIEPVRTMTIPYAPVAFTIDGLDNEPFWSTEQSTIAFNTIGSTGQDADFTCTFKVAWDENYLYFYGKILDDVNNSWEWGEENYWTYDNVSLSLDLDTSGSGMLADYDSNTNVIYFNRGIDSVGHCYFTRSITRSDHKYYWENTTDGWVFEVAIAWNFFLGPLEKPEDIIKYTNGSVKSGFDVSGNDSDAPGPDMRDCETTWDEDECNCSFPEEILWNNRRGFGVIDFQPKYTTSILENMSASLVVFPNPTTGIISFNMKINCETAEIINQLGETILTAEIKNNQIDLSGLPNGLYFAKIADNLIKVIKQ